jgi:PKD repeat protein
MEISFSYNQTCQSFEFENTSITGTHIIDSVLWNFGDGEISTATGIVNHEFLAEGTYNPSLTIYYDTICEANIDSIIYYYRTPSTLSHHNACLDSTAIIELSTDTIFFDNDTISPASVLWELGNGVYTNGDLDTLLSIPANANYPVNCILTNTIQCIDTITDTIKVSPLISAFTIDSVCAGDINKFKDLSISLTDPIQTVFWDFGDGNTSNLSSPSHLYSDTGYYTVIHSIITEQGCIRTDSGIAKVNVSPVFEDFTIENKCANSLAKFTVIIPDSIEYDISAIIWTASNTTDTTTSLVHYHYIENVGYQSVKMKIFSGGCSDSLSHSFFSFPIPISKYEYITQANNIMGNVKFINLSEDATDPNLHYTWDFGDGDFSYSINPVKRFEEDTIYKVQLVSKNKYNCYDTITKDVSIHLFGLHIPSALSPSSNDPEVSIFKPKGYKLATYHIEVFNNKGEILWESDKLDTEGRPIEGWDGYYRGKLLPVGTYFWRAEAVFKNGDRWKGSTVMSDTPQTSGVIHLLE